MHKASPSRAFAIGEKKMTTLLSSELHGTAPSARSVYRFMLNSKFRYNMFILQSVVGVLSMSLSDQTEYVCLAI